MDQIKIFTPQEATQTLPLVKKIVTDILGAGQKLRSLVEELGKKSEEDPRVVELMNELEEHFTELEHLGCSYKDWDFKVGLVDFPSKIAGEEVYLCWRSDEEELKFYHGLEEGFTGRKPIPSEFLT